MPSCTGREMLFGRVGCCEIEANFGGGALSSDGGIMLVLRLRDALASTELAKAITATIRVKLLKIGATILRNTRRVRILLASHHPLRAIFFHAVGSLSP